MDNTKETLLDWLKRSPSNNDYNKGIYDFRLEELPAEFNGRTIRTGVFCYALITKGSATILIDNQQKRLKRRHIFLVAPRMTITVDHRSDNFASACICLEPAFFDRLFTSGYAYKLLHVDKYPATAIEIGNNDYDNVLKTMQLFARYLPVNHPPEMIDYLANFLLLQIAEILFEHISNLPMQINRADELYRLFRRLLAENYRTEHNIGFYADRLNVSQAYLSRTVRKVSGQSIRYYISEVLLSEARRLLVFKDSNIKEIAEKLGFSDQSSFGKFFKKETGLSPHNYRCRKGHI